MKITRLFGQRAMMIVFVMFFTTGIISCETVGPRYNTARGAIAPLSEEQGRIVFYRPANFLWYGYRDQPDIFLNHQKVGVSRPGTIFYVDVEPGKQHVTIPASLYTGQVSVDVQVSRGDKVYVKNNVGVSLFAGKMKVEVVSPEKASTEIDGLEFLINPME